MEIPMHVETPRLAKRKPEEEADVSNAQVLSYMKNMSQELSTDIKDMKSSMSTMTTQIEDLKADFLAQIDSKFSELNVEIDCVKQKITDTDLKIITNAKLAEQNQKFINVMQQEKLIKKMEISGTTIEKNMKGEQLKAEVIKIIKSFGVIIKAEEVKFASIRQVNPKDKNGNTHAKQIINVELDTLETKLRVMKEKRNSKILNHIFFDNALTARNRFLMSKTRTVAKDKNFTAMIKNSKVCIKKNEEMFKYVEAETDLNEPKLWEENAKKKVPTTSNA
ncbi:hypothetical protein ACKWTF_002385 [Chironomus riparius]